MWQSSIPLGGDHAFWAAREVEVVGHNIRKAGASVAGVDRKSVGQAFWTARGYLSTQAAGVDRNRVKVGATPVGLLPPFSTELLLPIPLSLLVAGTSPPAIADYRSVGPFPLPILTDRTHSLDDAMASIVPPQGHTVDRVSTFFMHLLPSNRPLAYKHWPGPYAPAGSTCAELSLALFCAIMAPQSSCRGGE
jgi:hypothetical protein